MPAHAVSIGTEINSLRIWMIDLILVVHNKLNDLPVQAP